jgi:hypothetical protein
MKDSPRDQFQFLDPILQISCLEVSLLSTRFANSGPSIANLWLYITNPKLYTAKTSGLEVKLLYARFANRPSIVNLVH